MISPLLIDSEHSFFPRFRAQAELASVAATLPLDDSDDGDSMISGSTNTGSLSRNNSSGDVRKVCPEVLSGQNSNDVSIG